VIKSNLCFLIKDFEDYFEEICKKIDECDVCSFDCELSGITSHKDLNAFDTPQIRYDKIRKVFHFVQFLIQF
jgi:hypothetical protein